MAASTFTGLTRSTHFERNNRILARLWCGLRHVLALLLLSSLTACWLDGSSDAPPPPVASGNVSGLVLSAASGQPLAAATASIGNLSATTGADGRFTLANVPLFYFNETTGLWVEEGTATLQGTAPNQYYEGTVTHFTVWNADQVMQTISVAGCVRDTSNLPVVGAFVRSDGLDYSGSASNITDSAGNFSVAMRRGSRASIFASIDSRFSNTVTAGPSAVNVTLDNCLVMGNGTPVFVVQPASQSVNEGGYVVFQAIARGSAPLRYQWQRNGVDIGGATTSVLLVDPVGNTDNGSSYRAVATNSVGSTSSDVATLTVAALPPAIAVQPSPLTVVAGSPATFSVQMRAQGAPLQYQWRRNGADIPGATAASYTLAAATLTDNGAAFSVRISNSVGVVTSTSAGLSVTVLAVAPAISQQPANVNVNTGQSAQFSVVATGSAPLSYEWRRGGAAIAGATGAIYTLTTTTLADDGAVFSVRVSNQAGVVTSGNATLRVTAPPVGAGYYLIAGSGATGFGSVVFANGAQTMDSQALVAVQTENPAAGPVTVEAAGTATPPFAQVIETTLQGSSISNTRVRYSFYFKNSRLMRLDHVSPTGAPVGQVVSSLTSADVCGSGGYPLSSEGLDVLMDVADPGRSWVLLKAPGPDGQCFTADDVVRAVRANMAGSEAAVTLPGEPLQEINNSSGVLTGVIVRVGQVLRRLDASFGNPVDLHTLTGTAGIEEEFNYGASPPGMWLFLNNGVVYGHALDGSLGAPRALLTLTAAERQRNSLGAAALGDSAYLAISDGTASRIVRIDGNLAVTASGTGPADFQRMLASPSRLVFVSQQAIVSQPLAAGASTALVSAPTFGGIGNVYRAGETLYVSLYVFDKGAEGASESVVIVGTDGSNPQTLAATAVVGGLLPAAATVADTYNESVYALILAQGLTEAGQHAGATLRAIEGSTLVTYGTLPTQPAPLVVIRAGFAPFHYGQPGLLLMFSFESELETSDLFFFNSDAPGLLRLTNSILQPAGTRLRHATGLSLRPGPSRTGVLGRPTLPAGPVGRTSAAQR